jgi:predicted nucleic acid-binding protein
MSAERSVPNRIFIDTLFVIALINRRDQYHQQALDLAEQFEGAPLLVTDAVFLEIGNALARSYSVRPSLSLLAAAQAQRMASDNDTGFLITTYPTDAIKEGERVWSR